MSKKNHKLWTKFILILCLASMCVLFVCPPDKRPFLQQELQSFEMNLGLDLKGGSELLYEVNLEEIDTKKIANEVLDDSIAVISQRIFDTGIVKEPRINRQGENQIVVQLPGLNEADTERVKDAIEELGNLEWRLVAGPGVGTENRFDEAVEYSKYQEKKRQGQFALNKYEKELRSMGYKWFQDKGGGERLLWIDDPYDITGKELRHVSFHSMSKQLHFRLTKEAGKDFKKLTEKYRNQLLAIVFNNQIVSIAKINNVIGDSGYITGFTAKEANSLLKTMRYGSLDIQPKLLYKNTIGPSIGEDSVRLGVYSGVFSLVVVVVFIAIYYFAAGIVASLALLLNILLVFFVLVLFRETLTLPGIAGLILTVGMSIDANIIIFERIREERAKRVKKTLDKEELLDDIYIGFKNSFRTILDANITTFLTAAILYSIASGAIKGFAFTMLWGIVLSFFTAIFVTRTFLTVVVHSGMSKRLYMMQLLKKPTFAVTQNMRKWAIISSVAVVGGLVSFFASGDRIYGLDLRGGVLVQMSLKESLKTTVVRERLRKSVQDDLEVQRVIAPHASNHEFSIRMSGANQDQVDLIHRDMNKIAQKIRMYSKRGKKVDNKLVHKLKNQYQALQDQKKNIMGISELREQIHRQFADELAKESFGKITKIERGKLRNFIAIPIRLHTPVSSDFLKKLLGNGDYFERVMIAVSEIAVEFKLQEGQDKTTLKEDMTRHLRLARPSIKLSDIDIQEQNDYFKAHLSFVKAAPLEAFHKAIERCKFLEVQTQMISDFPGLLTECTVLVDLPSEKHSQKWFEVKKYVETTVLKLFRDAKFQGHQVHLSDPFPRFAEISGVVAKAQKTNAYRAILLSLIFVLLYIAIRFPNGWKYGIAAIVALAHDIAVTIGIVALFSNMGWVNVEINLPVIAALLTIVGYSLNDTIVIFDRLRENQGTQEVWKRLGVKQVKEVFDTSINHTLSRTILTSLTTLFVATILFVFNYGTGNVLEGFAFTLMVGVVVGTYSSIFVASSLALKFESKKR